MICDAFPKAIKELQITAYDYVAILTRGAQVRSGLPEDNLGRYSAVLSGHDRVQNGG